MTWEYTPLYAFAAITVTWQYIIPMCHRAYRRYIDYRVARLHVGDHK